jgi:cytoskeletal protein CcmA (bactofilin family)
MTTNSESVFGPGSLLEGDFSCTGLLRIEGKAKGKIKVDGTLVIAKDAGVEGDIEAHDVVVAGILTGTAVAHGNIRLAASAKVKASLRCKSLALDEGALFNGDVSGFPA